jgi:PKD repeat protein
MTEAAASYGEMSQEVIVSDFAGYDFRLTGYIQTELYPDETETSITDNDYGQGVVSFFDIGDFEISSYDTPPIGNPVRGDAYIGADGYVPFELTGVIPEGADSMEIMLKGFLVGGSYVNVFYDDICFEIERYESAWGAHEVGQKPFPGNNWATYIEFEVLLEPPVAFFTYSPEVQVEYENVEFDASGSSDPDGTIVLYEWDYQGDGTYDYSSLSPTSLWDFPAGDYTVVLRVTDNHGLTDTYSDLVHINEPPTAMFTWEESDPDGDIYEGEDVYFDASSSFDIDGTITDWDWDFDYTGTFEVEDSGEYVTYQFSATGMQTVALRVTDNDGATDITVDYIYIETT